MTTTTDPFDTRYLDELDLRRELTVVFERLRLHPAAFGDPRWAPAVDAVLGEGDGATAASCTSAEQDEIIDAWAAVAAVDRSVVADSDSADVVALVRRARQVRVRNDGLTRAQWIDRTFAGQRAWWARALVRSFGTSAGPGSCRCLDEPIHLAGLGEGWQCCGSPWLDNGDIERFIRRARRNVALLDDSLRTGPASSVTDPVCRSIITEAYLTYVGGPATERVAAACRR